MSAGIAMNASILTKNHQARIAVLQPEPAHTHSGTTSVQKKTSIAQISQGDIDAR